MIEIAINSNKVLLYHAADELPIKRYSRFQKYNLIESGVGSDMESIAKHFAKLFEFISYKLHKEALEESKNLYYSFYMMLEEINIPGMAFACLVYSINDEVIVDISEDNLKNTVQRLSDMGLNQKDVEHKVKDVKKKSIEN
jgi:hypothetical protein